MQVDKYVSGYRRVLKIVGRDEMELQKDFLEHLIQRDKDNIETLQSVNAPNDSEAMTKAKDRLRRNEMELIAVKKVLAE